jgi:hypothetical protein
VLYDGSTFTQIPPIPVNVPSAIIQAVKFQNKLIVTGNFYNSPNFDYFRLAQFDGTSWSQMGTGVRGNLTGDWDMIVYNDTLYIAGNFSKADGNAGNYIMKWDGNQFYDAGFGGWCGYGAIVRLLTFRNKLYALGGFNCALNQKAFGVAYYENGKWTVPRDSIPNGVADAVVYKDAIYIGGSFASINGDSAVHQFAKLMCPDFDASAGCISGVKELQDNMDVKVYPNPSNNKINFETNITIDGITITNTLGQELFRMLKPQPKQEINISNLPSGIYFLKAENKQGQGVFKIVKE